MSLTSSSGVADIDSGSPKLVVVAEISEVWQTYEKEEDSGNGKLSPPKEMYLAVIVRNHQ